MQSERFEQLLKSKFVCQAEDDHSDLLTGCVEQWKVSLVEQSGAAD
jgi:hypothetical protein